MVDHVLEKILFVHPRPTKPLTSSDGVVFKIDGFTGDVEGYSLSDTRTLRRIIVIVKERRLRDGA